MTTEHTEHEPPHRPRRRRRTSQELTAEALPLDPPAWTLTREEFRERLGDLTLTKLSISPHSLHGPGESYCSYAIAGDIACQGMRVPLATVLDGSKRYEYATFAYTAGLPDRDSQEAREKTQERQHWAEKLALAEAKGLLPLYRPYLGRPVKDTLTEPTRGAPLLRKYLAVGTSAHWNAEHAWEQLVAEAMKAKL